MKKQTFGKLALLGLATGLMASSSLIAEPSPVNTGREIARGSCGSNTCGARTSSTRDRRYDPVADNATTPTTTPAVTTTTTPVVTTPAPAGQNGQQSSCSAKNGCKGNKVNGQDKQMNNCAAKSSCSGKSSCNGSKTNGQNRQMNHCAAKSSCSGKGSCGSHA